MEVNFNQPQRQSLLGILVIFLESIFHVLKALPIVVVVLLKSNPKSILVTCSILLAVFAFFAILSFLKYRNFTFYIDDENDEFIINDGVINKSKTIVQLHKIHQVNIKQNLIQRIIGVYALDVDTAGSDEKEGSIKAISHQLAIALKSRLLENDGKKENVIEDSFAAIQFEHTAIPFLKINWVSLLKIGLTSNYVKSVGLILTFFFTIYENLHQAGADDIIQTERIEGFVDNNLLWYSSLVFVLIMFSVVFLINIGRTLIKFFDYTVVKQKGSLMLTYGLISTQSTILKPEKVQIVKISRNYLQKKMNVLEVKIRQAISNRKDDEKSLIEIPGCNTFERDEILKLLFNELPERGIMMKSNFRKLVFSIFLIIVIPLTGYFLFGNYVEPKVFDYVNVAVFYVFFFLIMLFFGFKNYSLFISNNHIVKQSGSWDVDSEIIQIEKIQAITTSQLFWHKRLNIGSLTMHTAGGNITFHLGKFDKINEYVNLWLYEIETSNSNWM